MKTNFYLLTLFVLTLCSCNPKVITSIAKTYPRLDSLEEVKVIEIQEEVPANSEFLGEVKIEDTGFSTNCDYETVINAAKLEVSKAGGNALRILSHQSPDLYSSCHRINASIYRIDNTLKKINLTSTRTTRDSSVIVAKNSVVDTIEIYKPNGGSVQYKYKGENLTYDRMKFIVQNNAVATNYLQKAQSSSGLSSVMGYAAGFLIGYPLGTLIGGGTPNWALAGIGCGILLVAIPISSSANNNIRKAVSTFNSQKTLSQTNFDYDLSVGISKNGFGVYLRF
jgi:hypothetical protein